MRVEGQAPNPEPSPPAIVVVSTMPDFFLYILQCADDSFYVGTTTDVARRELRHQDGRGCVYTSTRRPVRVVYQEQHATLASARARERQLKCWTYAKKAALIRGDLAALKRLSACRSGSRTAIGDDDCQPRSGRTPWRYGSSRTLALAALEPEDAAAVLRSHSVPEDVADVLAHHVSGTPYTLRLAADLVQREGGVEGIRGPEPTRFLRLDAGMMQGALYRQALDQVRDPHVRPLAQFGLVLRVITPEVIWHVLAGPCELPVHDIGTARRLFDDLRREVVLFVQDAEERLLYRPALRQVMLPMIRADRPDQVAAIHQSAVAFYAERDGVEERAEEVYHRLAQDEEEATLDARWLAGVEHHLSSAIDEVGPRARAYLLRRLKVDLPPVQS